MLVSGQFPLGRVASARHLISWLDGHTQMFTGNSDAVTFSTQGPKYLSRFIQHNRLLARIR